MCWCGFKKSRLVKEQEAKSLLSNLGIKTPLNKFHCLILKCIKMNEIVNKFLFAGDKFMTEMHLKQPGLLQLIMLVVYSQKNKERTEKFMQTGNTDFIYKNELDKACFQHNMAYAKWKDLTKRTQSDKVLRDKTFKIASDPKHYGFPKGLASMN